MKRFFKTGAACVLALALMSTSAFATVEKAGSKVEFGADGKLNVTVAGTTAEEQVALLVLKGDNKKEADLATVQNTDIVYIDQKTGTSSLAFSDINVGETTAVTVFAGSTNTTSAILLGSASRKAPELNASAKSFNVAAGVETPVSLKLTDEKGATVTTNVNVTYKEKNAVAEYKDASTVVSYDGGWKFNFSTAKTYEVMFEHNGVSIANPVVVCVYEKENLTVDNIGKDGEEAKPFVMKESKPDVEGKKKVVAAVRVTLAEKQNDKGWIIWSIKTDDGVRHYTNAEICDITGLGAGTPVDFGCKFVNNTEEVVTAVNVIYKDAAGKVFFTDPDDALREEQ